MAERIQARNPDGAETELAGAEWPAWPASTPPTMNRPPHRFWRNSTPQHPASSQFSVLSRQARAQRQQPAEAAADLRLRASDQGTNAGCAAGRRTPCLLQAQAVGSVRQARICWYAWRDRWLELTQQCQWCLRGVMRGRALGLGARRRRWISPPTWAWSWQKPGLRRRRAESTLSCGRS